jgi:hypothetical protein
LLLDAEQKKRLSEAGYTEAGAEAVARRLNLQKK